jgi:hypothetical protein
MEQSDLRTFFYRSYMRRTVKLGIALLFVGVLCAGEAAPAADTAEGEKANSHVIEPADLSKIRWLNSPAVSPDGTQVAFTTTEWDESKAEAPVRKNKLWLVSVDGGEAPRQVAAGHERTGRPQWSPDGHSIAFISGGSQSGAERQIWLLALAGGESSQLTKHSSSIQSFEWSPDGKQTGEMSAGSLIRRSFHPLRHT